MYFLTFNEPCFIRRIIIHTNRPVKNIDIYIRVEPETWKRVKHFKTLVDATTPIDIATRGEAIRVVQTVVIGIDGGYDEPEHIQNIEAFGSLR